MVRTYIEMNNGVGTCLLEKIFVIENKYDAHFSINQLMGPFLGS